MPAQPYAQSQSIITPHQQARQDDRPPKCGAPADNAGVDPSGHFGSARACKRRAKEHRSYSSFSTSSRLCAWLSVLYHSRERLWPTLPGISPCRPLLCQPRHALFHTVHVCKPPYASVECTLRMYVCCMQYAACSCPASTTSATGSNSRVLTPRLTVCSRSELLHREKYSPLAYPDTRI